MSKLKYYGNKTIILPDAPPSRVNGIVIPEAARKPTNTGTVISIADNEELKEGDTVAFNYRSGYELEYQDTKYLSINSNYILAKTNPMQPLHSRVLIQPIKKPETLTEGGVVLLEDKTLSEGRVLKTGNGTKDEPMVLESGDIVIYPKNAGVRVGDNIILTQAEVMAINNEQYVEEGND